MVVNFDFIVTEKQIEFYFLKNIPKELNYF